MAKYGDGTLNDRQAAFVREYLVDLNATQAAIRVGYSAETAQEQSSRLLSNVIVARLVEDALAKRAEKTGLSAERVLLEIQAMAFYDPAELLAVWKESHSAEEVPGIIELSDDGRVISGLRGPLDIKRLPEMVRRAIVGWGYDKNQNFTVKLADKSKALDQLARHLSLYRDELKVTGLDGLAERLARAQRED